MKNKKLIFSVIIAIVLTIVLVIVFGKGKTEINSDNPEFSKYISAYTSGVISKKSSINVRISSELSAALQVEKIDNESLFEFNPSIEGEVSWLNDRTIEFKPKNDLSSGTEYYVEFNLDELKSDIEDDLSVFAFKFQTIKQGFEVSIEEQKTIDKKTLRWQKAIGVLQTADDEDLELIKKVLHASQEGKELSIKWKENDDAQLFYFEIDSISRGEKASEVILEWDGSIIDSDIKGDMKIEVPSLDDFKFMSYKIVHQPEQYLQLQFSDPLQENQYLKGLLHFNNISGLRYIIEDNVIKIYPPYRLDGTYTLHIEEGVKNILGYKLKKATQIELVFEEIKPAVRFVGDGVILPSSDNGLIVPFEAVNITAVDVRIVRIYENNVIQFLQVNEVDGDYQLRRVGKTVLQKTVPLNQSNVVDLGRWNRFSLDMNELIETEPGAIYRISINFRKKHSLFNCGDDDDEEGEDEISSSWTELSDGADESSYWDYFDSYYYGDYNWEHRDDPCYDAYYGSRRMVSKNIIASNLGMIAKKGNNGSINVIVTDLRTTKPLANIDIEIYDYQQQLLKSIKTNTDGIAAFPELEEPFFIIAKNGKERGYLKLNDGASLSLSRFDVSGVSVQKGLKGFIYGERGVWRPGDSLYISFILEDINKTLPADHPVVFELRNPAYQLIHRFVQQKNNLDFYTFRFKTDQEAPTGDWQAKVEVGGATFTKYLKIETIKPNRLKIKIDFGKKYLVKGQAASAIMNVKWLHGAIAKNLDAMVEVVLTTSNTYFEKYKDYTFDDQTKSFYSESDVIFDGTLDETGNANVNADLSVGESAPGKLRATFITKVFEKGGDFSIDQFSLPYNPYTSYVGIKMPKGDKARKMLLTDTTHTIKLVTVDENGKLVKESHRIEMTFYKIDWRWWWEQSYDNLSKYSGRSYVQPLERKTITSSNGKASWKVRINYPDWGRYLVRAHDLTTGHSTSKTIYIDWPGWAGREQKDNPGGATMLSFTSDNDKYSVGEKINLTIPSSAGGRALISIETGSKVIETHWVETQKDETKFSFTATKEMTPNIYVNVTMLQPHAQTANDLPIRMYGILPVTVEDPSTHLEPVLKMPDVLQSEETVTIKVSEKNNQKMTYTIAMVDEGLLDLTRFQTPDPWNHFYAKEALGVKTWDIYDWVIGAYGGELERILSIGGGMDEGGESGKKANRFKPMVKFLGPFHLKGGENKHTIEIPKYIGSVRTMVIAGHDKAYGSVDKTTPVRKPLMILGTLPRVLGPGETVKLPVNVFAMENHVKNVSIQVKTNKYLKVVGGSQKTLKFTEPGDDYVEFELVVQPKLGIARVEIIATSGKEKASFDIELDVRNPNPRVTDVISKIIEPGQTWTETFTPVGITGTNKGVLEISSIPPLNLEKRLKYLIKYPHGCVEQVTSSAFPQLFLDKLVDLTSTQKKDVSRNIKYAIKRLQSFQMFNGGLSYWPGGSSTSEWGTNYAGHFLVEADKKGYTVSSGFLKKWIKYQKTKANSWTDDGKRSHLMQAYRLYTLALADKPVIGAMNRLKEKSNLSNEAKWRLAAAYQLAGKEKTALKMITGLSTDFKEYYELSYTFGSSIRDKAMVLETLVSLKKRELAFKLLKEISADLASERWYSTQTTAYSLVAISKYVDKNVTSSSLKYTYKIGENKAINIVSQSPVSQSDLKIKGASAKQLTMKNTSTGMLYARIILEGVPLAGNETDSESDLKISVKYMYMDGSSIDPTSIVQGTDFMAEVKITHPGISANYKEMALTQIFPSGWEIINTRMLDVGNYKVVSVPKYLDIRDDRVYTYFDINRSRTKTFRVLLNASYVGKYYLPVVSCEAMYDATINARKAGKWVEVVKSGM